jgi:hypothetical protein
MTSPKAPAGGIVRTSLDNTWRTPPFVLERVRVYFRGPIPFDPLTGPENPTGALRFCAGAPGTLFASHLAEDDLARRNGLEVSWDWPTWVNPPYGEELRGALRKIEYEARLYGETSQARPIIALLPCSRFEQPYLTRLMRLARATCFHRGRIAFVSSQDGAQVAGGPYASMIVGFGPIDLARFVNAFEPLGACFGLFPIGEGGPAELPPSARETDPTTPVDKGLDLFAASSPQESP